MILVEDMDIFTQNKSDVSIFLYKFYNQVVAQLDGHIKTIRIDNCLEFQSQYLLKFYHNHGIVLQTSCPCTPQPNGVVECKHRYLLETARALCLQFGLTIDFCGEYILTSTYLINHLPSWVI